MIYNLWFPTHPPAPPFLAPLPIPLSNILKCDFYSPISPLAMVTTDPPKSTAESLFFKTL